MEGIIGAYHSFLGWEKIIFHKLTLCTRCYDEIDQCFERYRQVRDLGQLSLNELNIPPDVDPAIVCRSFINKRGESICEIARTIFLNVFGYSLQIDAADELEQRLYQRRDEDLHSGLQLRTRGCTLLKVPDPSISDKPSLRRDGQNLLQLQGCWRFIIGRGNASALLFSATRLVQLKISTKKLYLTQPEHEQLQTVCAYSQ